MWSLVPTRIQEFWTASKELPAETFRPTDPALRSPGASSAGAGAAGRASTESDEVVSPVHLTTPANNAGGLDLPVGLVDQIVKTRKEVIAKGSLLVRVQHYNFLLSLWYKGFLEDERLDLELRRLHQEGYLEQISGAQHHGPATSDFPLTPPYDHDAPLPSTRSEEAKSPVGGASSQRPGISGKLCPEDFSPSTNMASPGANAASSANALSVHAPVSSANCSVSAHAASLATVPSVAAVPSADALLPAGDALLANASLAAVPSVATVPPADALLRAPDDLPAAAPAEAPLSANVSSATATVPPAAANASSATVSPAPADDAPAPDGGAPAPAPTVLDEGGLSAGSSPPPATSAATRGRSRQTQCGAQGEDHDPPSDPDDDIPLRVHHEATSSPPAVVVDAPTTTAGGDDVAPAAAGPLLRPFPGAPDRVLSAGGGPPPPATSAGRRTATRGRSRQTQCGVQHNWPQPRPRSRSSTPDSGALMLQRWTMDPTYAVTKL